MALEYYINFKTEEYLRHSAKQRSQASDIRARLYIKEGGLEAKDWATISEYTNLLRPFKEATVCLEGRGVAGTSGAIWEVLPTFYYLVEQLHRTLERLENVDFEDPDAPEDHV